LECLGVAGPLTYGDSGIGVTRILGRLLLARFHLFRPDSAHADWQPAVKVPLQGD